MKMPDHTSSVLLKAGGALVFTDRSGGEADVSETAAQYLWEPVALDGDVTLRDIFVILQKNLLLQQVYRRQFAEGLLNDAYAAEAAPYRDDGGPDDLEYLELRWDYILDLRPSGCEPMPRVSIVGEGFVCRETAIVDGVEYLAGLRETFSLAANSASSLLNFPLRLETSSKIWFHTDDEPNGAAKRVNLDPPTLGQLLHGILYGLSWFGCGEEREETLSTMLGDLEWSEPMSGEEMMASLALNDSLNHDKDQGQ